MKGGPAAKPRQPATRTILRRQCQRIGIARALILEPKYHRRAACAPNHPKMPRQEVREPRKSDDE